MKLTLVIIVCVALYTATAAPPGKPPQTNWIDRKFKKFLKMANIHASECMPREGQMNHLCEVSLPSLDYLNLEEDEFKWMCITPFAEIYKFHEKNWDIMDKVACQSAHDILTRQIPIWIDVKYKKFLEMAENHAKKLGYHLEIDFPKEKWQYFKSKCVDEFEDEYGPSSSWKTTNEEMCLFAYSIFTSQKTDMLDDKYQRILGTAKQSIQLQLGEGSSSSQPNIWTLLESAEDDIKKRNVAAYEALMKEFNFKI